MAYDEELANRVRRALGRLGDFDEKRMFGGLTFMVKGRMCCGVVGRELMVRVGPETYAEALAQPHAREMTFTGRPLAGMVYVAAAGLETDPALRAWTMRGWRFVSTLPIKPPKTTARKKASTAAVTKRARAVRVR
jgi:TfoX/Sxy family transcriptional regulator of competence genes